MSATIAARQGLGETNDAAARTRLAATSPVTVGRPPGRRPLFNVAAAPPPRRAVRKDADLRTVRPLLSASKGPVRAHAARSQRLNAAQWEDCRRIMRPASPGQAEPRSRVTAAPARSAAGGRAGHDQTASERFCDCCCLTCRNSLLRVITCVHPAVMTQSCARHKNRGVGQQREQGAAEGEMRREGRETELRSGGTVTVGPTRERHSLIDPALCVSVCRRLQAE